MPGPSFAFFGVPSRSGLLARLLAVTRAAFARLLRRRARPSATADASPHATDDSPPDDVQDARIAAAEFVTAVSDYRRPHLRRPAGRAFDRARWLPHAHDVRPFERVARAREPIVLAAGRLVDGNGFDLLLRAWPVVRAAVPDARLVIAGRGVEERALRALARRLRLSGDVYWAGVEPHDRLHEWLAMARVFCLPRRTAVNGSGEGAHTVLLAALGAGLPCVSTTVSDIGVVRDGREGRLVTPESPDDLAGALVGLLRDPLACEVMGRRARERAEELFELRRSMGEMVSRFGGGA